jgi:hypothetical protein
MLTGWEFFKIYHALDLHFHSPRYNVFDYGGRVNVTIQAFENRNDKGRFVYWANKLIGRKKAGQFCIANFVHGDDKWLYQAFDNANGSFLKWTRIRESITKVVADDVSNIIELMQEYQKPLSTLFDLTPGGNYPPIWQMYVRKVITPETAIIINEMGPVYFDTMMDIAKKDPFVADQLMFLTKYAPFVKYDPYRIQPSIQELEVSNEQQA